MKLQRKFPELFQDLCLYCDVSVLLGQFQFRLSSRKFIQELFVEVNLEQVRGLFILSLFRDLSKLYTIFYLFYLFNYRWTKWRCLYWVSKILCERRGFQRLNPIDQCLGLFPHCLSYTNLVRNKSLH